jgi:NAD(P)-dependent dehydrogenase (short-subunit alcohol dehydrogenase family)
MSKLRNKVAIVTGGAGGIGRAYTLRLAQLGADVAIIDIDLDVAAKFGEALTAATVMDEVKALGGRSTGLQADLSDRNQAVAAIEQVVPALLIRMSIRPKSFKIIQLEYGIDFCCVSCDVPVAPG